MNFDGKTKYPRGNKRYLMSYINADDSCSEYLIVDQAEDMRVVDRIKVVENSFDTDVDSFLKTTDRLQEFNRIEQDDELYLKVVNELRNGHT